MMANSTVLMVKCTHLYVLLKMALSFIQVNTNLLISLVR